MMRPGGDDCAAERPADVFIASAVRQRPQGLTESELGRFGTVAEAKRCMAEERRSWRNLPDSGYRAVLVIDASTGRVVDGTDRLAADSERPGD